MFFLPNRVRAVPLFPRRLTVVCVAGMQLEDGKRLSDYWFVPPQITCPSLFTDCLSRVVFRVLKESTLQLVLRCVRCMRRVIAPADP